MVSCSHLLLLFLLHRSCTHRFQCHLFFSCVSLVFYCTALRFAAVRSYYAEESKLLMRAGTAADRTALSFMVAFCPQMSLVCLSTCLSASSHFTLVFLFLVLIPHAVSIFFPPPFTLSLFSHCSLPLLHLFSCHGLSPSLWFHRNCWVIPLTGTAQLIGLNSFWQILSLSSRSPYFPKYGLFSAVCWLLISPSFFLLVFFFLLLTTYLHQSLPKSFRPLAFLSIFFFSADASWWQSSFFLSFFSALVSWGIILLDV